MTTLYKTILITGMLASGSLNTLSKKAQNDANSKGIDGDIHTFSHPWFQTLIMVGFGYGFLNSRKYIETAKISDISFNVI
jgi:hypothetical protein